ncbi:MAG: hypothetical protein Q8L24_00130 [bacterium]|nr:hypothetical protein [bacterium]
MALALKCEQCEELLKGKDEARAHDCRQHTFKFVRFNKRAFCERFGHTFKEVSVVIGEDCLKRKEIHGPESCGVDYVEQVPANACKVKVICGICGWTESNDELREKHELKPRKSSAR